MAKQKLRPIAQIHNHINVYGGSEASEGEVLLSEQIAAIQRFIRWHARQLACGQALLCRLQEVARSGDAVDPTVNSSSEGPRA